MLFIEHMELDHLSYHIWDGLCRILGDENVVTFPFKDIYAGKTSSNYILDDGKQGYTAPPEYILPRKLLKMSIEEIISNIDDFDFVISSPRTHARNALKILRPHITQPLVILDGEDGDLVIDRLITEFKPDIYFKREYLKDKELLYSMYDIPIYPCPFAAVDNTAPAYNDSTEAKEISVFSVHGNTHPLREAVSKRLLDMNIPESYIWINSNFYFTRYNPYTEEDKHKVSRLGYWGYLEHIAKSKIGVSVRGWGRDSLRRFEIPLYETLLFTHDIGIETPYPFEDEKTCVMFKDDLSDFQEKLEYYLQDENECRRIAKAGKKHLYRYHTTRERVDWMLSKIKEAAQI